MRKIFIIIFSVLLFSCNKNRKEKIVTSINKDSVVYRQEKHFGVVNFCGNEHYHPVDIKAKQIYDSLKKSGIDSIIIFRHWFFTNGFNGYGKVMWLKNNTLKQLRINFDNSNKVYDIDSIIYSESKTDSIFSFYFQNHLDKVQENPTKESRYQISHGSSYFVYSDINGKTKCFKLSGSLCWNNPKHPRSKLIGRLSIEDDKK